MLSRFITSLAYIPLELIGYKHRRDHFFAMTDFLVGEHSLYVQTHRTRFTFGPGISEQVETQLFSCRSSNPSVLEVLPSDGREVRVHAKSVGTALLITQAKVDGRKTKATTSITIHDRAEPRILYPIPGTRWESEQSYLVELALHAPTGEYLGQEETWRIISGDARVIEPGDNIGFELVFGKPGFVIVESKKTG